MQDIKDIKVIHAQTEAPTNGYMVVCALALGDIHYGLFDTIDEATKFGSRLINATIYPIYTPTLH